MKVLAIGSDRSVLNPQSASSARQVAYGTHLDSLDIIVFSLRSLGLPSRVLSVGVRAYPTSSRTRLLYGWDALMRSCKLAKPDVVSVQDPFEAGCIGWIVARLRGAKFHVQVHTDVCAPSFRASSLINRIRFLLARFVLRRADRIRVVSMRIQADILNIIRPQAPISVLPIFTDIEKYKNAFPGELAHRFRHFEKKVLVVARLEPEKNVALAIESFAKAAPESACLIIVGEGSERKMLQNRVSALHLTERVFFEGAIEAIPYYALADLVLVPSFFEGYGLVIVEALAAGKPVISNDVGIAREAGAIITDAMHFPDALKEWFVNGPHKGTLQHYPYTSFDSYVEAYAADIIQTAKVV